MHVSRVMIAMRRFPALGARCRRLLASDPPCVAIPVLRMQIAGPYASGVASAELTMNRASHGIRPFTAMTGMEPASPVVSTLDDFKALTNLSINTPIVVYATATAAAEVDSELVRAVHASGGAVRLAQLDAGSAQLSRLASQLHITTLPATLLLFGGRLMDSQPGAPSGQALRDYLTQIQKLADDVARHRAQQVEAAGSERSDVHTATPEQLLGQGCGVLGRTVIGWGAGTGMSTCMTAVAPPPLIQSNTRSYHACAGMQRCRSQPPTPRPPPFPTSSECSPTAARPRTRSAAGRWPGRLGARCSRRPATRRPRRGCWKPRSRCCRRTSGRLRWRRRRRS